MAPKVPSCKAGEEPVGGRAAGILDSKAGEETVEERAAMVPGCEA